MVLARGLERFAADLPDVDTFVTLGEGDTPLLELPKLGHALGLRTLKAKMESCNPTGSYKDRVASLSVSLAMTRGLRGWIATSSGNAGMSFASYGARAGLPGLLCVVSTAPAEKRMSLAPYGVRVVVVDGVGLDATGLAVHRLIELVEKAADRHDLYLGITANTTNPDGMRGIETIGYELAEQDPDATHIYVPTGGGGLAASLARGLKHRKMATRVVACQPAGCAPIVRYLQGELPDVAVSSCTSGISALQLPRPPDGALAVDAIRGTGGWGTAVEDSEILDAQRMLARSEGVFAEPAAAASLAALMADVRSGRIKNSDRPVLLITGAGWKDLNRFSNDASSFAASPVDGVGELIDRWAEGRET